MDRYPTQSCSTRLLILLAMVSVCSWISGCGEAPEVHFAPSERSEELIDPFKEAVVEATDRHFGQPGELVSWNLFSYGGEFVEGTATAVSDAPNGDKKIKVEFDEVPEGDLVGDSLQFKLEKEDLEHYHFLKIKAFDKEKSELLVSGEVFPEVDNEDADNSIAIAGSHLRHGYELYRVHCLHCHGINGDGKGPTGKYMNPQPRDYRLGKFKFKSTTLNGKPTQEDLARVISDGIPGTYMPSFKLLKPQETAALVDYVQFLAIRGEFEKKMIDEFLDSYSHEAYKEETTGETPEESKEMLAEFEEYMQDDLNESVPDVIVSSGEDLAEKWEQAIEDVILPELARIEDDAASRARGKELFFSKEIDCASCHGPQGRGDGPSTEVVRKNPLTNEEYPEAGLYDDWGNKIKPRNLRKGQFRGGRRPIDVYRRLSAGIPGTPMQGFARLGDEKLWDLVNYVLYMPHEDLSVPRTATNKK